MDEEIYFPAMSRCDRCGRFVKRGLWNWINHELDECPGKSRTPTREGFYRSEPWHFPPMSPTTREAFEGALASYFDNDVDN